MDDQAQATTPPPAGAGPHGVDPPDAAPAGEPFPWPPPPDASVTAALAETWTRSVFRPAGFFRAMPVPAPPGPAVLYYLLVGMAAAAIELFWTGVLRAVAGSLDLPALGALLPEPGGWPPLVDFLLAPIPLLLGLAVFAGAVHLVLLIAGGAGGGMGATVQVLCFAYGPALFSIVPGLGDIVGLVWMLAVATIGLREAHRTDGWRAALGIFLPIGLLLAVVVVGVVAGILLGSLRPLLGP